MVITIFTDGSSRGNPGPGGWGVVILGEDRVVELGGGEAHTTNNRMELSACIESLKFSTDNFQFSKIQINTDSEYVLKGITEWIHNWIKKGWKTASKKPVENQDLWKELYSLVEGRDVEWKIVRGHAGVDLNERCDEIATSFADGLNPNLYDGPRDKYPLESFRA